MTLYVLDTDHLSLYQRGHETIKTHLLAIYPDQPVITVVTAEEFITGRLAQLHQAKTAEERLRAYGWFTAALNLLCGFTILPYDLQAENYFQQFRSQKIRVGTQDLKIAAMVLSRQATLVTRNQKDFARVPGLKITDWSNE